MSIDDLRLGVYEGFFDVIVMSFYTENQHFLKLIFQNINLCRK